MPSAEYLREFVTERLTAAAEEIFGAFQQTVVEYEKEIDRQRRLLDVVWKPEIRLHRIEYPQQHVWKEEKEEKGLVDQQICHQEKDSSLNQEDTEPPQIKEEPEELCDIPISTYEQSDHSEPEPKSHHQILPDNSHAAVSQDHREGKHGDWRSTQNAEPKPKERHLTNKSHSYNHDYNFNLLEIYLKGKKSVRCGTCGKTFKYECQLNVHLRSHTGEKPYLCKTCGKRFRQSSALNTHVRIHTGEKPYTCTTCGRDFRFRSVLSAHMRSHTGEKPHLCKTCGQRFSEMQTLKRHMRIHTGEKPYTCTTCGKDFRSSSGLSEHKRTHTGEKPHACTTCGKNFITPGSLKRHSRTHTGEKAVPLQELWKKIPSESIIGHSFANLHGQEAVPLQDLREKIHSTVKTESPHYDTQW